MGIPANRGIWHGKIFSKQLPASLEELAKMGMARLVVFCAFLIDTYYAVIMAWALRYVGAAFTIQEGRSRCPSH